VTTSAVDLPTVGKTEQHSFSLRQSSLTCCKKLLKVAKEVYFDATFKVVPGIYYQLLGVFAPCGDTSDCCEACLLQPREGVALVPCGHSRFRGSCADTVASLDRGCPICRTAIRVVLRLYG